MTTTKINNNLAKELSKNVNVRSVKVVTFLGLKGSKTNHFDIDIDLASVKSRDEYDARINEITELLPNVLSFKKAVDRYGVKLTYGYNKGGKGYRLNIDIPCYEDLTIISQIAGCELVEKEETFKTIICKDKAV